MGEKMDKRTNDYIKSLQALVKQRELYKLRNDAQRYLQLGEQTMYERIAPLIQKPVTEKLEEVKQVLQVPIPQTIQAQTTTKSNFDPLEVFEKIIERIALFPSTRKPSESVRVMKTNVGYAIGSNPIDVVFHDQGRDIKMNDYQMPFSEDLEKLLLMPKVTENGEELKKFKNQTLQDYVNLLTSSKTKDYKKSGNYKQAARLLKDDPPSYRVKEGKGLDEVGKRSAIESNEAIRVLTLLAAKAEGHNNVDKELKDLLD